MEPFDKKLHADDFRFPPSASSLFIFISFGISMEFGESSTPERAVPRKAKHVDVIADKHDVTNLFSDIVIWTFAQGQHYFIVPFRNSCL